jgi:hypothetical protein
MSRAKKLIVPFVALMTFSLGIVCLMLPFLPFGWLLMGITTLLLVPYFKPLEKLFRWLAKKDKTGFSEKARLTVEKFYIWIGDRRRALKMRNFLKRKKRPVTVDATTKTHDINPTHPVTSAKRIKVG